jgi:hypothetical protein
VGVCVCVCVCVRVSVCVKEPVCTCLELLLTGTVVVRLGDLLPLNSDLLCPNDRVGEETSAHKRNPFRDSLV